MLSACLWCGWSSLCRHGFRIREAFAGGLLLRRFVCLLFEFFLQLLDLPEIFGVGRRGGGDPPLLVKRVVPLACDPHRVLLFVRSDGTAAEASITCGDLFVRLALRW